MTDWVEKISAAEERVLRYCDAATETPMRSGARPQPPSQTLSDAQSTMQASTSKPIARRTGSPAPHRLIGKGM